MNISWILIWISNYGDQILLNVSTLTGTFQNKP